MVLRELSCNIRFYAGTDFRTVHDQLFFVIDYLFAFSWKVFVGKELSKKCVSGGLKKYFNEQGIKKGNFLSILHIKKYKPYTWEGIRPRRKVGYA